ncbi:MAG: carboxypeptidase regulatory-like domain-containing protein [Verrucomicrobia bacterium]|nr:carboxypeptidase regulatory-like domain-containing protein [Verrucomicrobiota bacterium]
MRSFRSGVGLASILAGILAVPSSTHAVGNYAVAFWREAGAYENQAPPAGEGGNHSAFVHVWDENGQPLAGKQIYTSWGVLLGATDANGYAEIELRRPNGYDFQIRDGAHLTGTTPVLSEERPPSWGRYSFEVGFQFKQNAANPGTFDTSHVGTLNASGSDPCRDLSAPHTRSLAFHSTFGGNYCSDQFLLGNWTASHGQTFVATGNRVVAVKAMMAAGFGVHYYWTAQVLEGGPGGTPIGPPRSTRLFVDGEYYPILVKWGVNDVQVVPGRTYFLQISHSEGLNAYRVNRDNDPTGHYFEYETPVPGAELMGLVVCANYTNAGPTGTLTGFVRDATNNPLAGAVVSVPDAALYSTTTANGGYAIPFVPAGTYDVVAAKAGYVTRVNTGVAISQGLTSTSSFNLTLQSGGSGIVTNGSSLLQPFESVPAWNSTFDATWGSAATFALVNPGQTGNALQATRGGPGSSARVQVLPVKPNTPYALTVWSRCPSFSSAYWAECGYRLGSQTAQDFDANAGAWTLVKKFSNTGANGNGNVWTPYTVNFTSGANTQVSVGFKLGASTGTGPTVQWDQLALVSLALPGLALVVADTPTQMTVSFTEPVSAAAATNLLNFRLTNGTGLIGFVSATLTNATNVVLATAPQPPRLDHTLTVSNVTAVLQPSSLTGRNGQLTVRVPLTLVPLDDTARWQYEQTGANLGTAWRGPSYDDSAWPSGAALLAESSGPLPEPIRTLLAVATNKPTFYFRTKFAPPASVTNALLRLRTVVDDGAVFWLNGAELFRLGLGTGSIGFTTRAARTVGLAAWEGPFDFASPSLLAGTNVLAVEVHQAEVTSPDAVFGATVEALVLPSQRPLDALLSITRHTNAVTLVWTEASLTLEWATNVTGPWTPEVGTTSPATVPATNAALFFRLK